MWKILYVLYEGKIKGIGFIVISYPPVKIVYLELKKNDINFVTMTLKEIFNVAVIDRRKLRQPIPRNPFRFLNEEQLNTYNKLIESGWKLYFIRRRPRIRKHTIAMINNEGASVGVIEDSGNFAVDPLPIKLRH